MTQPLMDEEMKEETMHLDWMKGNWKTEYEDGTNHKRLFAFGDALIATVESLKDIKRHHAMMKESLSCEVENRVRLEKENEILIGELKEARALNGN